jgi:hypothetical protein
MTNITNVITTTKDNGMRMVTIEFPYCDGEDMIGQPNDVLEMECLRTLRQLSDDNVRHWLCDHRWERS